MKPKRLERPSEFAQFYLDHPYMHGEIALSIFRAYLRLREAALQDHGPSIRHPECPLCAALGESDGG